MTDELTQAAMMTWTEKVMPARLNVSAAAKLLGFTKSDIQILMALQADTTGRYRPRCAPVSLRPSIFIWPF